MHNINICIYKTALQGQEELPPAQQGNSSWPDRPWLRLERIILCQAHLVLDSGLHLPQTYHVPHQLSSLIDTISLTSK